MQEIFIGEYIRHHRQDKGLSQEKLCEGICEPMTLSRLENGSQTPSFSCVNALLQRLGLPDDRFTALLSQNELEIVRLRKELVAAISHHNTGKGWETVRELDRIAKKDDQVVRQVILRAKAVLGREDKIRSPEETLAMLEEALRITSSHFDPEEISRGRYCAEEIKIINSISDIYSEIGERKKAADILSQLLRYIQKQNQDIPQLLSMVAYNYAIDLTLLKRYEEAIETAELCWQSCVERNHYQFLPGSVHIIAECRYFLGELEESARLYTRAYYLYRAIDEKSDLEILTKEAKEHLGLLFKN